MSFDPDWVIAPGETLREWMEENRLPSSVVAKMAGLHPDELDDIVEAREEIDERRAEGLAAATLVPARFWLALERNYRAGLKAGKIDASKT
jgi:HTH-type transcriptional regulator / antitoxin HigA